MRFLEELIFIRQANQNSAIHKFQSYVCNKYHDLSIMSMKLRHTAVLRIINADYCCIITGISKSEAANLQNAKYDLIEKSGTL